MPETIRGDGVLQRQEELALGRIVMLGTVLDDAVDDGGVGDSWQEVVQHEMLIVLAQDAACLIEALALVDQRVVGTEEGEVELGDDQILVIARIPDLRGTVMIVVGGPSFPGQVVEVVDDVRRSTPNRDHRAQLHLVRIIRIAEGGSLVETVQVQRRFAHVAEDLPDRLHREGCYPGREERRDITPGS